MIMITRLSIAEHNHVVDDDRDVGVDVGAGVQYDDNHQMTSCRASEIFYLGEF